MALAAAWMLMLNPFSAPAQSTPGLTITASGSTTVGLQIFANSNLTGGSGPSGTISFRLFGPGDTACTTAIFTSTVPVAGTSMNSARYTTAAAGTYRWTSTYNGDANNNPVGPTSCSDPNGSVIVQGVNTYLSVTAPAPSGGAIHGVAALAGGVNPTGSISFFLSGPGDQFCSRTIFTSTVAVAGNGSYASANYIPTVAGTYRWRASYTGDTNNMGGTVTSCLDPNDAVNVTTVGQPPPAAVTFSPAALNFSAPVGTASAAQTVTVANTGGTNLAITAVARGGTAPGDYTLGDDHCTGATVAPGTTCTIAVTFTPTAAGTRSAALTTTDNAPGSPHSMGLSGQGTTPPPDRGLLTYPVNGQSGVDTTRAFTWAPTTAGQSYFLVIGTSQYGTDLVNSGILPANQAAFSVPALPPGRTLYATLLTETNGGWTLFQAITFTAAPGRASFINPANGQTNIARSTVFSWSTIPQGEGYFLVVGTARFGSDVVNSGILPATQSTFGPASLPAGKTLYATLLTKTNGGWTRYQDITFTSA